MVMGTDETDETKREPANRAHHSPSLVSKQLISPAERSQRAICSPTRSDPPS